MLTPYNAEESKKLEIVTRLFHNLTLQELQIIESGLVPKLLKDQKAKK
jgi:hypothetical protein